MTMGRRNKKRGGRNAAAAGAASARDRVDARHHAGLFWPTASIVVTTAAVAPLPAFAQNAWTGATSTDWFTASNWSEGVPDDSNEVVIDTISPNPTTIAASAESSDARIGNAVGSTGASIYACQESIPFNSPDGLRAVAKAYRFPFLEQHTIDDTIELFDFCKIFTPAPREGFHDPVVSDLPTLALAGLNDTQTNGDAAVHVARTLSRAQPLTFPESGHGVLLFSQCARDIASTFIEHPDQKVDSRCIAKLKPQFYIPAATPSAP
jgi:hypothetical protein